MQRNYGEMNIKKTPSDEEGVLMLKVLNIIFYRNRKFLCHQSYQQQNLQPFL